MSNYYTPSISTGKLQIDGNLYFGIDQSGNIIDASGISSTLRAVEINAINVTASTINTDNLYYQNLDLSGNLTVGGDLTVQGTANIGTINFTNLDVSGNATVLGDLHVDGETDLDVARINILTVGKLIVDTSGGEVFNNLEVSENLTVGGTITTNSGFEVDLSGNATVLGELGVSENLTVGGSFTTNSGFEVDLLGNLTVTGGSSLQSLVVDGQVSISNNQNIGQNSSVEGGQYIGGGLYVSGGITVGTIDFSDGVRFDTSGLDTFIHSVDTSGVSSPIKIIIDGTLETIDIDVSGNVTVGGTINTDSGFEVDSSANVHATKFEVNNSYTLETYTDISGNTYVSLDSSNNSVGAPTSSGSPVAGLYVYVNGTRYILNLFTS